MFKNLHAQKIYPTRSRIANIKRSDKRPEIPTFAAFNLDYTVSSKQFFRIIDFNKCQIQVGKKNWIDYEIVFPSSLDHRFTGRIAKPRFIKRKSDGVYVGICSYEYEIEDLDLDFTNILGVDIGKIKLFSAVVLSKDGHISEEFINSAKLNTAQEKLNNLFREKEILFNKIASYERLRLTRSPKYRIWRNIYEAVSSKIINTKLNQAKLIANEVVSLALEQKCSEIHIENLSWLNSRGGKWNHSEIHSKIEEKAQMYKIKVKRVSAFNSSKEHPITKEVGEINNRTVKFKDEEIDRDLLAAINLAVRSTTIKLKQSLPKKTKTRRVVTKSRRREIKELVNKIKGEEQIVSFLANVSDQTEFSVDLEVRPLSEVLPLNSLLSRNYQKLQF